MVEKESYDIIIELYGVKINYIPQNEGETASMKRISERLEIKKKHKDVTIIDALRTIACSSLAEKIADEFEKEVKNKQRDYLVSIGACAALYLGLDYIEIPIIEGVGKAISVMGTLSACCLYYNVSKSQKVVHYFLREKI